MSIHPQTGLKSRDRIKQVAWAVGTLVFAAVLVIIEASNLQEQITVRNVDFFGMSARAKLLPGTSSAWVNGFYPVGIPLLLRIGLALGLDVVRSGQIISILGGVLCLYGGALFAWHLTKSRAMVFFTMACLVTTRAILSYSGFEGTDILAAGWQVLALGILARDPRHRRVALLAGIVTGLGYLVRYTALVTFAIFLLYLLAMALYRRERSDLWAVLMYGLGFLVGASPQVVPSLLIKGNPFYQTQSYHIWIKLHGGGDFVRTAWRPTPIETTLWRLFWLDPPRFITNWWHQFSQFWLTLSVPLVDQPLAQLAKAGFLFASLDKRRLSVEHRMLLSFFVIGVVSVLSIFNIATRFLILMVPVFAVCAIYFLWRLLPASLSFGRIRLPVNVLALIALLSLLLPIPWEYAHTKSARPGIVETSNMLHAAGAQTADQILSTELRHQDVASPTRDNFAGLLLTGKPESVSNLRQRALESGFRFIIYHSARGSRFYSEYEALLWPENRPSGYTPIWASPTWVAEDRFAVYRIEPDSLSPQTPTHASLTGGVSLLGYDLIVTTDQPTGTGSRVGLYLYWQTTEPLTESLKVFVHLFDPQGNLITQHDSVPAMWTYPTCDWQPGEVVVDFHWMGVPPDVEPGDYTIAAGFYSEESGERWPVLDASGQPSEDQVVLTTIDFNR